MGSISAAKSQRNEKDLTIQSYQAQAPTHECRISAISNTTLRPEKQQKITYHLAENSFEHSNRLVDDHRAHQKSFCFGKIFTFELAMRPHGEREKIEREKNVDEEGWPTLLFLFGNKIHRRVTTLSFGCCNTLFVFFA